MFVLKSLGRFILGNYEQRELLTLPSGRLYKAPASADSKGAAQDYELLHEDTALALRRGPREHEYLLAVDTLSFPIVKAMDFVKLLDTETAFRWTAASASYRFVVNAESTTATTVEMFHVTVAQCIYESASQRSHTAAKDSDIQELLKTEAVADKKGRAVEGEAVFESEPAGFYAFDTATNTFIPQTSAPSSQQAKAYLLREDKRKFWLIIKSDDTVLHAQPIDPDATQHTDRSTNSFIWCHLAENGFIWTFSLKFEDTVALLALVNAYGQVVYELLNNERLEKRFTGADADYILNPFLDDVEMAEPDSAHSSSEEEAAEEEEQQPASPVVQSPGSAKDVNTQLVVGYKNDRSFVSRGSALGVFRHTDDDKLVLHANLNTTTAGASSERRKDFTPSKMMLYDQDSSMLLQNPDDPHRIYRMDLERGQVVDEWTVHPDAPCTSIIPDSKYAQMTSNPTLIGLNARSIFRIDPRLPGSKRVESEMKSYVVKNDFSCGVTTGTGKLAVASARGEIRLFNQLDKRAKTLLPMFGDPIVGIDTTESGRFIVATCRTYLLFICTEIPGSDALGFSKPMGADKPIPRRLQLRPEHVAYMGSMVSFTPARFSTGDAEERAIITSTGPFVVTWNLRRVRQGHLYDYQIKRYGDRVVADSFRYGADRSIVVTLPHHVTMVSKSSLQAASPKTLIPPRDEPSANRRSARNRTDVVDSPF